MTTPLAKRFLLPGDLAPLSHFCKLLSNAHPACALSRRRCETTSPNSQRGPLASSLPGAPSHGNGVTWGAPRAPGAAVAVSVVTYPAARAGAGRPEPPSLRQGGRPPEPARRPFPAAPSSPVRRRRFASQRHSRGPGRDTRMAFAGARRLPAGTRAAAQRCCGLSLRPGSRPAPAPPLGPRPPRPMR